jgi:hypothetical protein
VPQPTSIDFYRLPRPVQDRFVATTRGTAPPPPLLFAPASRSLAWSFLGASAAVIVVGVLVLLAGSGDPKSPVALHGLGMLTLDAALFSAASFAAVHALALLRKLDTLPFRQGLYLFPGCVVEARSPVLRVWRIAEVESTQRVSSPRMALELKLRDGSVVSVPARSAAALERAEAALAQLRPELLRAVAEDDTHALAEMDPLHDKALSSPVGPSEAMKPSVPAWVRFDWAIALGLGVLLGVGLGTTRNDFSDAAMFHAADAAHTQDAYKEYLAQGGRHSALVRDTLLPQAELREAEASGTVETLQAFAASHASTKIGPDIQAAIRRALLAQLAEAKKVGTVTALDAFVKKYPNNNLGPELKAARHALYAAAFESWKQKAQPDAATSAFFTRLLGWAEANGPSCELRFRFARSKIEEADSSLLKSPRYPGPDGLASRYITGDAMRPREQRLASDLIKAFADAFPADLLALEQGPPLEDGAIPTPRKPTLLVDYVAEWSHVNTLSIKPASVFAGINFSFDTTFSLPAGDPYELKTKATRIPEPWKIKIDGLSREDFEQKVYDAMIDGAFDAVEKKLMSALF